MRQLHPWEQYLSSHPSPARPYYFLRHSCLRVHASVTGPFELSSQCSLVQIVIAKSNNTKCFPGLGTGNTFGRQLHCLKLSPMLVLSRAVAACSDAVIAHPHTCNRPYKQISHHLNLELWSWVAQSHSPRIQRKTKTSLCWEPGQITLLPKVPPRYFAPNDL